MDLKTVRIDERGRIFLDEEEILNVSAFNLKYSADSEEPAKLTVTVYVNVGKITGNE